MGSPNLRSYFINLEDEIERRYPTTLRVALPEEEQHHPFSYPGVKMRISLSPGANSQPEGTALPQ